MTNLADYRIKIFTRSMNYELYCYSQHLISFPFERVRLTKTTADGYLYKIIEDKSCDIAINIDEDAFVVNEQAILDLVRYVVENNYANAGMADGGEVVIRGQNPIVTNPFFNVLNLKLIRTKYNRDKVSHFDYSQRKNELIKILPKHYHCCEGLNATNAEPYYPLFFWIAYNFKTLYLPAKTHNDGISTILLNQNQVPMLYHTWYARHFKSLSDKLHSARIQSIIDDVYSARNIPRHLSVSEQWVLCIIKIRKQTHQFIRNFFHHSH